MFYQAACQDLLEEQLLMKVDGLWIGEDIVRNVLIKLISMHSIKKIIIKKDSKKGRLKISRITRQGKT